MDDPAKETRQLLITLKSVLKATGLNYADIAAKLGVSESTIKRNLNNKGLTLDLLHQFCALANITFAELASRAAEEFPQKPPFMTQAQEAALIRDITFSTTFYLLTRGWPPERIGRELGLDSSQITLCLTQMDRLGLIALFPQNRVRVLRSIRMSRNSAIFGLVARRVYELFDKIDLDDPAIAWTNGLARLSPASFSQVSGRLDELRDEIFELGKRDLDLPSERVAWYAVFAAVKPVQRETLFRKSEFFGKR